MKIFFTATAAKDLEYWKKTNIKIHRRIAVLLRSIQKDPLTGIGKPEKLTGNLSGLYSRRINHVHRLVYGYKGKRLLVYSCRYHYE